MNIDRVNIKIIDTATNTLALVVERTQAGAPSFIYNGKDDRFSTIVASEFHFNMEVTDMADAKYLHLFTGSETRYKVELEDFTDSDNPVTLWTGFLLPEQFGEPWTNNVFFVSFIATDGLGRIKEATLADTFYGVKKAISVILADCLKLTGLSFKIFIAPAIINSVQTIKMSQLAVDTTSYVGTKKNKNPYEILDKMLLSIGCKLKQWQEAWYVIGINRETEIDIEFEEYDNDGVYVQQTTLTRNEVAVVFNEHPTVSLQPQFKHVIINWDKDQDDDILPDDIIYQPFEDPTSWNDDIAAKHWLESNSNFKAAISSYEHYIPFIFTATDGGYLYSPSFTALATDDPFWVSIYPKTVGGHDADVNYISLEKPIYLEASSGNQKNLTLDIEFKFMSLNDISTAFNNGDYDASFLYELRLDDTILISNKSSFTDNEGFQFDLKLGRNFEILGTLKIKAIPIGVNGLLDIRLSAPIAPAVTGDRIVFKTVKITYPTEDEVFNKTRDIDFTTSQKLDVYHSDDRMDITNRQWLFTDDVTVNITTGTPALTHEIAIRSKIVNDAPQFSIMLIKWYISTDDYLLIRDNPGYLYIEFESSGVFTNYVLPGLSGAAPVSFDEGGWYLWELIAGLEYAAGPIWLFDNNKVWILAPSTGETITDIRYLRERWRRYEQTEEIRYIDALARIYHDTVKVGAYKISGIVKGFINPLELATFTFINGRKFIVTNNTIAIDKAETNIELVEAIKENVTDYV